MTRSACSSTTSPIRDPTFVMLSGSSSASSASCGGASLGSISPTISSPYSSWRMSVRLTRSRSGSLPTITTRWTNHGWLRAPQRARSRATRIAGIATAPKTSALVTLGAPSTVASACIAKTIQIHRPTTRTTRKISSLVEVSMRRSSR